MRQKVSFLSVQVQISELLMMGCCFLYCRQVAKSTGCTRECVVHNNIMLNLQNTQKTHHFASINNNLSRRGICGGRGVGKIRY